MVRTGRIALPLVFLLLLSGGAWAAGSVAEGTAFQVALYPEGAVTRLYLADADTNEPVGGAAIEAEAPGWRGTARAAAALGVYELDWPVPQGGADLALTVAAGGRDDLLLVAVPAAAAVEVAAAAQPVSRWVWPLSGGAALLALGGAALARRGLRRAAVLAAAVLLGAPSPALAHGGEDHGAPDAGHAQVVPGATVAMSKPTQFLLGVRTIRVEPRQAADTVRVVGRVIPDPAGYARVQPSQPARILADPAYPIPVPGQTVRRGQVLAVLEPTLSTLEKGDKRALLSRVDGDIALTERDLGRQESLGGLVPVKQVEATRIRLDQLRKERGQITGTALGRELLTAPVDGVVADIHVVPGEVVAPDRVLVEIVDPARLRVEAVVHDLPLAPRISAAEAASKVLPDRAFPLTLLGISPKIDPQDQGLHVIFQVAASVAGDLRVGMPVDVFLSVGATRLQTAVPRGAIAELGGRQVVFVRTAPETFEARPVRVERIVGPLAEITDGVRAGDRVVVVGTGQLRAER